MKAIAVVGEVDAGRTTVVERLVERLREHGSVGTVERTPEQAASDSGRTNAARYRAAGATETYGVPEDGDWFATGERMDLDAALDRLAARHDYALVEGYCESALPKVVVGDRDAADPVLARTTGSGALDVDAVLDELADLEPRHTLDSLVADVKTDPGADRAGAVATFTGRVRAKDGPADVETTHLVFEKYENVAETRMTAIRTALEARDGVHAVRLHHRSGVVDAGEDIVFVVVLAGHRREAFRAVEDGIDRLKEEVPLFKKEVTVEDEFWRHDSPGE